MYYAEMKNLISDISLIDTVDTASSMIQNLFSYMLSYERFIFCSNVLCLEPETINQGIIIPLNTFDGDIDMQEEIDSFFQSSDSLIYVATNCEETRTVVMKPKEHIIIELLSIHRGEYYL